MKRYIWNIVQAFDRLANAVLGGTDKEYISSRVYRYKDKNRIAAAAYYILNKLESNHCENAYLDAQIGFDPEDAVWR
jgi:hypothetical protein